jgi:hypothetical protein
MRARETLHRRAKKATKTGHGYIKICRGKLLEGASDFLMSEPKKELPRVSPGQAAPGAVRAEKVRSSRYEWENKSGENENPPAEPRARRGSMMTSFRAWLRKLSSTSHGFFDNDDDATPSAA